jgi:hypothetical protein
VPCDRWPDSGAAKTGCHATDDRTAVIVSGQDRVPCDRWPDSGATDRPRLGHAHVCGPVHVHGHGPRPGAMRPMTGQRLSFRAKTGCHATDGRTAAPRIAHGLSHAHVCGPVHVHGHDHRDRSRSRYSATPRSARTGCHAAKTGPVHVPATITGSITITLFGHASIRRARVP